MVGTALVRRPGPRLHEGQLTHVERRGVDLRRAARQHAAYRDLLARSGWAVREVEPADDLPDAAFVEDTAVFLGGRALLTRPGHPSRRDEVPSVAAALEEIGVPVVELPGRGTLDGGDVLRVGRRFYVGRSTRTDSAGIEGFASVAAADGHETVPVRVERFLHLKTAATALPDGAIVAAPALVDADAFAAPEALPVPEPAGANVLVLGSDRVAVAASAPGTAALLRERGLTVEIADISEFEAVEAGMTCLSVLLPGVDA